MSNANFNFNFLHFFVIPFYANSGGYTNNNLTFFAPEANIFRAEGYNYAAA